ncbi:putative neutral sphingomyelinase isoform X1 [Portunus trituberculatus]|uniref:putative neutral sphingomyelinase isoform X1 n=1 Tax=Portunus trituberculatus TaxID=210409 RepID=UPI001E1D1E45|nr:putative neutral sphingomyelinase isoform X1 [Portunus trituberculatus]
MTVPERAQKDSNMTVEVKVLTLNVWGIPGISKDREARMEAIVQQLVTGNEEYDFVFLQEVWSKADYTFIASKVNKVLPYSHTFYSGFTGSGLCVLSRSPITEVHYHRFALNGYPHKLLHGDWWGGKGVALCRTTRHGIPMLLATTHFISSPQHQRMGVCARLCGSLPGKEVEEKIPIVNKFHAEYNPQEDEYVHHRLTQAFETSELIRFAKKTEEVLICAGDFNCTPTDFAYRMVKFYAGLVDSYTDSPCKTPGSCGETNQTPANSYTNVKTLITNPSGNRIDYIFYQASSSHKVKTKLCDQPWPQRVPQRDFSFSDHEAVRAVLTITPVKDEDAAENITELQAQTDALLEGAAVCEQGLKKVACNRRLYLTLAGLVLGLELAYLAVLSLDLSLGALMGLSVLSMVGMLVLAYLLHMGTVFSHLEYSGVQAARLAIKCHLEKLTERNAQVEQERKHSSSFIK